MQLDAMWLATTLLLLVVEFPCMQEYNATHFNTDRLNAKLHLPVPAWVTVMPLIVPSIVHTDANYKPYTAGMVLSSAFAVVFLQKQ